MKNLHVLDNNKNMKNLTLEKVKKFLDLYCLSNFFK